MSKKPEYHESSGNVFADLGVKDPEEALAKSELARQIAKIHCPVFFSPMVLGEGINSTSFKF